MKQFQKLKNEGGSEEEFVIDTSAISSNLIDVIDDVDFNKIYYYEDVTEKSALKLIKNMERVKRIIQMLSMNYSIKQEIPIELHVCSGGGIVHSGLYLYDYIKSSKIPVHTYVDGWAASAATFITIAGTKRFMSKNSTMMIHELRSSGDQESTYSNLKDAMVSLDHSMKSIVDIYCKNSNFRPKALHTLLKKDLYLSSEECIKHGIVDFIV